jgi:hypothetical protein
VSVGFNFIWISRPAWGDQANGRSLGSADGREGDQLDITQQKAPRGRESSNYLHGWRDYGREGGKFQCLGLAFIRARVEGEEGAR